MARDAKNLIARTRDDEVPMGEHESLSACSEWVT